jgi:hypothetical protein
MTMPVGITPTDRLPSDLPKRAYNLIWNEFFRSQELQTEVTITTSEAVLKRNWRHDYYSASLLDQQRGVAPALPISGSVPLDFSNTVAGNTQDHSMGVDTAADTLTAGAAGIGNTALQTALDKGTGDLSGASTFDIASLRLAVAQQKYLERNNRAGARYAEWLRAHYGVSPNDQRLQRPAWMGATTTPISVSEVLQTSEDGTTPQGTMAGHGITFDASGIDRWRTKEWGVILGLMTIMPEPAYQQGVDREWIKETRYDFYITESASPGRNLFDLSYDLKMTADMGMIIPTMLKETMPGDVWDIKNAVIARLMPLVAPVLHRINLRIDYFFTPYRILWDNASPDNWEDFIT